MQPRSDPLISEYLLPIEDVLSEPYFKVDHCLRINDAFSWVAVVYEELLIADQDCFALFNVRGQSASLEIRLQHFLPQFRSYLVFVLERILVIFICPPDWRDSHAADRARHIGVHPHDVVGV